MLLESKGQSIDAADIMSPNVGGRQLRSKSTFGPNKSRMTSGLGLHKVEIKGLDKVGG